MFGGAYISWWHLTVWLDSRVLVLVYVCGRGRKSWICKCQWHMRVLGMYSLDWYIDEKFRMIDFLYYIMSWLCGGTQGSDGCLCVDSCACASISFPFSIFVGFDFSKLKSVGHQVQREGIGVNWCIDLTFNMAHCVLPISHCQCCFLELEPCVDYYKHYDSDIELY